jgi:indole-3-acetate monooxygenase
MAENHVSAIDQDFDNPVDAARDLTVLIRAHAGENERGRRLAAPVVDALRSAGLLTMGLPKSLGGSETSMPTTLRAIEQIAYADGATAWNVMIAFDTGMWAGYLHVTPARTLIASIRQPILAGSVNPPGGMTRITGGFRLTGRWRFGSGCQNADVFIVGALLFENGKPTTDSNGTSQMFQAVIPAADIAIHDTWHVSGLRGTGSHDFGVEDLFVPEGLVQPLHLAAPAEPGALYTFGLIPSFAVVKTAVALGVARHAIEALKELAASKTAAGQTSLLRERPAIQTDVARAEACVRSARAFMNEVVGEVWESALGGKPPTTEQRAWLRLAATDGVQRAVEAVDLMFNAGAGTAIYESSPLERCFRDAHVIPAHIVVQPNVYEVAGRVFLNLAPSTFLF